MDGSLQAIALLAFALLIAVYILSLQLFLRLITLLGILQPDPHVHLSYARVTSSSIGHRSPPSDGCASLTVRSLCDVSLSSVAPCSLLRASSSSLCVDHAAILMRCIKGRSVAKEAQMHPSETSMKLQMLRGIIVSVSAIVSAELFRAGQIDKTRSSSHHCGDLHVKSSEREKSRTYLKRTRVAMQALSLVVSIQVIDK